jgi:hypothetical protein
MAQVVLYLVRQFKVLKLKVPEYHRIRKIEESVFEIVGCFNQCKIDSIDRVRNYNDCQETITSNIKLIFLC